ncbi:MAG: hypothetical protein GX896_00485 [Clostridiales bacterium]|nr:hypothetical protein [Clostridiales bacterium]
MNSTVSGDSSYKTIVYAYTAGVLEPQKTTPALFDTVKYVEVLEGEIEQGKFLDMPINAVAIQADYLDIDGSNLAGKIKNAYEKYRLEAEK